MLMPFSDAPIVAIAPLPSSVQIGPMRYSVEVIAVDHRLGATGAGAATLHNMQQRITINEEQGPDQLRDSLLHELIHAALRLIGYDFVDQDERMVGGVTACYRFSLDRATLVNTLRPYRFSHAAILAHPCMIWLH